MAKIFFLVKLSELTEMKDKIQLRLLFIIVGDCVCLQTIPSEDEVRHHILAQFLPLELQCVRGPAVLQGGDREGVALQTDPAVLQVEGEVMELHGTGGGHTQPHLVADTSAEINLETKLQKPRMP